MEWKIPEEIRARSLKTVQWMMVYQVITYSIPLTCESKKPGTGRWRLYVNTAGLMTREACCALCWKARVSKVSEGRV